MGFILLIMWCCNLSDLFNVFDILLFLFCFVYGVIKGQGQWVIKYYINIYEKRRRWFVIQSLNWARGGKHEEPPGEKPQLFFAHTALKTHIHAYKHTARSLSSPSASNTHLICELHRGKTMDGRCNFHLSAPLPWTSHLWTSWFRCSGLIDHNRTCLELREKHGRAEKSSFSTGYWMSCMNFPYTSFTRVKNGDCQYLAGVQRGLHIRLPVIV